MKSTSVILSMCLISAALAQDTNSSYHYVAGMAGPSIAVLGSSEHREALGISYGYAKPEPRFHFWNVSGQLVYEGYVDNSYSIGERREYNTVATGFLAFARWMGPRSHCGVAPYFEFGWGFQMASATTIDLSSDLNSTPWAGIGLSVPLGSTEALVGVRFIHISNGGLVQPNRGQDEMLFTVQFKV